MWLKSGDHSVLVSPQGGSILQWQWREHFILGPARMVRIGDTLKMRGETHWCYPNFGTIREPKYVGFFPQHGFLRNRVLDVTAHSTDSVRFETLTLLDNDLLRVGIRTYRHGITAYLLVTNDSGEERIPTLPALHPYFSVPRDGLCIGVAGKSIENTDIPSNDHPEENMIIERRGLPVSVNLHGIGRVHLVTTGNCSHVVIWSDKSSEYVCVEPIFGKPGTYGTEKGLWLNPGETAQCEVGFHFEPA